MSVYMTISLTVERYLSVVRPLLALRHRSTSSYLFLAAPGMLFSLLFTLPNYFILTTELDQTNHEEMELLQLIGNDSLMDSSWLPEVHQPCRIRLVWAHWRFNHAFKTVSSILMFILFPLPSHTFDRVYCNFSLLRSIFLCYLIFFLTYFSYFLP
jgi:hypothetical protein